MIFDNIINSSNMGYTNKEITVPNFKSGLLASLKRTRHVGRLWTYGLSISYRKNKKASNKEKNYKSWEKRNYSRIKSKGYLPASPIRYERQRKRYVGRKLPDNYMKNKRFTETLNDEWFLFEDILVTDKAIHLRIDLNAKALYEDEDEIIFARGMGHEEGSSSMDIHADLCDTSFKNLYHTQNPLVYMERWINEIREKCGINKSKSGKDIKFYINIFVKSSGYSYFYFNPGKVLQSDSSGYEIYFAHKSDIIDINDPSYFPNFPARMLLPSNCTADNDTKQGAYLDSIELIEKDLPVALSQKEKEEIAESLWNFDKVTNIMKPLKCNKKIVFHNKKQHRFLD